MKTWAAMVSWIKQISLFPRMDGFSAIIGLIEYLLSLLLTKPFLRLLPHLPC